MRRGTSDRSRGRAHATSARDNVETRACQQRLALESEELAWSKRRCDGRHGTHWARARRRQPEVHSVGRYTRAANAIDVRLERQHRLRDLKRSEWVRHQALDLDAAEAGKQITVKWHDSLPGLACAQGPLDDRERVLRRQGLRRAFTPRVRAEVEIEGR